MWMAVISRRWRMNDMESLSKKKEKYTTYIVLIGLAILAIWIYKAHNDYSIIRMNNAGAKSALRGYVAVQNYHIERNPNKTYLDNFRNFHYCNQHNNTKRGYINKNFADAFLIDNVLQRTPTCPGAAKIAVPYNGYLYQEDFLGNPGNEYDIDRLAFIAFPAQYGVTGTYVFWVDKKGTVLCHDPHVKKGTRALELVGYYIHRTPLNEKTDLMWKAYE